jgi:gluconate 5-dehydrogenase
MAVTTATDSLFSVGDQVIVVSGGTRGIGRAISQGYAERGAEVVVTGRTQEGCDKAAAEMSGAVTPMACDVSKPEAVQPFVEGVLLKFGRIDTLVNVAGVNRRKPSSEVSDDDYDFVLDTNLKGAFVMSQAVGAAMVKSGAGSQINVTSVNSVRPVKNVAPYAMSKAGMLQMTRALAMEWGDHGVRVNAIAPGFILTDLTKKLWSDPGMQEWGKANTPQRRLGVPEDLVGAAVFLASPASAFMTGQELVVDGGFTAGWAWPIPDGGGQ